MLFFQGIVGLIIAPSSKLLQAVSSIAGANPAGGLPGRLGETEPHSLTEKSASYGEVDSVGWNPPYKNLRFHRKRSVSHPVDQTHSSGSYILLLTSPGHDFNLHLQSSQECSICLEDLATNQGKPWPRCGHLFHESCITSWQRTPGGASCPICRATPPARPPASEDTSRRNGPQDASRSRNRNGSTGMVRRLNYLLYNSMQGNKLTIQK
ncbi:hypothetical protein PSTT_01528 [Puccinia striiformis]|uniref:RING-type domain-containing protein n=1 Tax=Puccinia striiformis TaxID=27350 RepID=A0A2S4W3J0_9BASI|nr:hypothetical protein PSTT_01528 [Puccinia striiformis]